MSHAADWMTGQRFRLLTYRTKPLHYRLRHWFRGCGPWDQGWLVGCVGFFPCKVCGKLKAAMQRSDSALYAQHEARLSDS